jgi:ubiquinol-cytochrome c reductase iron-sulfur subunit
VTSSKAAERQETQAQKRPDGTTPGTGNEAIVAAACVVAVFCTLLFAGGLLTGASLLIYGTALAVALFALAFAVRRFFAAAYPQVNTTEDREIGSSDEPGGPLALIQPVQRRALLQRILAGAAALFGVSLLAPITTLGPRPADVQRGTGWRAGVRMVNPEGRPLRVDDVPAGGLAVVWPEGTVREEIASVILLRLASGQAEPPTNLDWVIDGEVVAYSKVCTHVGCPVGLFQARTGSLFCPCHQQAFDARRGAEPTFGPAARPLPQLPLGVNDEGFLIALGDFEGPIGPAVG